MKRRGMILACAAMLCCSACSGGSSTGEVSSAAETQSGLKLTAAEDMDARYGETLKRYFEAVEAKDYDAYLATVYPPYAEVYGAYLESHDSSLQAAFESMCTRFDEDGYESWTLTDLDVAYYSYQTEYVQSDGIEDFFNRYVSYGVFDEAFVEQTKADAEDMHDVTFTLRALYAGDDEPVTVASGQEIMMIINKDGCWLFG